MMDARRLAMLEAMGVEVLALRARAGESVYASTHAGNDVAIGTPQTNARVESGVPNLCIVCAQGVRREARLARLFAQLTRALGVATEAIDWLEADARGTLPAPPMVRAYLVLGSAMAPALGAQLSTAQQNAAVIAVTADVASLPGSAADKRALWQTLRPVARRLAAERAA